MLNLISPQKVLLKCYAGMPVVSRKITYSNNDGVTFVEIKTMSGKKVKLLYSDYKKLEVKKFMLT